MFINFYKLAVSPKDISVRSIVEILEGGIFNKINEFEHLPKEVSDINASVNEILSNIRELILDYLMEKTLDDLVSIYQKKSAQDMYYI